MTGPSPKRAPECKDRCAYGICGGGDDPCGGCCGCLGPCVVAYERQLANAVIDEQVGNGPWCAS